MDLKSSNLDLSWNSVLVNSRSEYRRAIEEANEDINAFVSFEDDEKIQSALSKSESLQSLLSCAPFAIKQNISHAGHILSCASRLLENFISPITATAVTQLLQSGAVPVGRTNMDEFGMGSDTTNSIYGCTNNPWNIAKTAGGSSGGSASAVASGCVPFALGSDTGGSIRQPASFCGIWGLKPSYGAVSRYGLVAFASSLDVIGILAESLAWTKAVFSAIKVQGRDARDASSFYPESDAIPSREVKTVAVYRPKSGELDSKVENVLSMAARHYEKLGYKVIPIDLPFLEYAPAVYVNIATAEASSNLARFDGIRYGSRGVLAKNNFELIRAARSNGFGDEVTLRIITGCLALRSGFQNQCYIKARNIRRHMQTMVKQIFSEVDILVLPVFPIPAFCFDDSNMNSFHQKLGDVYSVVANLVGVPALSMPISFQDNIPIGVQTVAPHYGEERLFDFAEKTSADLVHRYSPYAQTLFEKIKDLKSHGSDMSSQELRA